MSEFVTLLGTEEVSRAASRIESAAGSMENAAASIDHSHDMFLRRFEDLVSRMEAAVEKTTEPDKRSIFEQVFGKR